MQKSYRLSDTKNIKSLHGAGKKGLIMLTLFLLLTGTLAGCAKQTVQEEKNVNKGRYIEEEIALPEGEYVVDVIQNSDQQLQLITLPNDTEAAKVEYKSYTLQSNGQWEKQESGWLNKINDKYLKAAGFSGQAERVIQGGDGAYYALVRAYSEEESRSYIFRSSDGKEDLSEVEVPYLDELWSENGGYTLYTWISDIYVLENGVMALNNGKDDCFHLFSKDGKELEKMSFGGLNSSTGTGNGACALGNELLGIKTNSSKLVVYDEESRTEKQSVELNQQEAGACIAKLEDGTILLADKKGIHRLNEGGTLWETIADGELNSMSMPTMYMLRFFAEEGEKENYYILYSNDQGGWSLIHYVFDENIVTVPEDELTVYSLKDNATVRQAISLFQRAHQEVKVNYVIAMKEDETNSKEYIKSLNTELIAGKGADVLILDGLPADSYRQKGVLKDITEICEQTDVLPNVKEAYRTEGKIYQMPLKIEVPLVTGSKEAVDSARSLADIVAFAKQHEEKSFVKGAYYKGVAEEFLKMEMSSLIADNRLDTEAFGNFLEELTYLKETGSVRTDGNQRQGSASNAYYLKIKQTHATWDRISSISTLFISQALCKEGDYKIGALENSFYANGCIAINQATQKAELAEEFVSFILSDTIQKTDVYDGLPVSQAAWDKLIEKENKDMYFGISYELEDGSDGSLDGAYPEKKIREEFAVIAKNVTNAVEPENTLADMIITEMEGFFEGGKPAEQVIKSVESKVNTYLTEQKN